MTPHLLTRSQSKKTEVGDKTENMVGATNNPTDGATLNHNNAADTHTGVITTTLATAVPDVTEVISRELSNTKLSGDMLSLINVIGKVIQSQFEAYLNKLDNLNTAKDGKIAYLESKVSALENKISELNDSVDDIDQYERRDTVIINGPSLPDETPQENCTDLVVNTIKNNLHINMTHTDINVAHRLGPKQQGKKRPVIVKLHNRAKKYELVQACITVKPQLYINESLTPKRRSLYTIIRKIKAQHKHILQQCYTSDGKIIVKLRNSPTKYIITSEQNLAAFLDKHPIFKAAASTE